MTRYTMQLLVNGEWRDTDSFESRGDADALKAAWEADPRGADWPARVVERSAATLADALNIARGLGFGVRENYAHRRRD